MKPWRNEIQQHIQNWSNQLGNLGWWPKYAYHFTDVRNAASVLQSGVLYCRLDALQNRKMQVDNASPDVMEQTRPEHTGYVRLYFRPKTPTQYRNEGIRPSGQRELGGAHCPVPVYFCFDALEILSADLTEFSNGNMGSPRASHSATRDHFFSIPFRDVFHNGAFPPEYRDEIIFRRNAEILVPQKLSLSSHLRFIACRSSAERLTLLHLLPADIALRWQDKIRLGEQGFFERKWTYIEEVVVVDDQIIFRFNPSSLTPGPFNVKIEYQESGSFEKKKWEKTFDNLNQGFRLKLRNANEGNISVWLDDSLAYSDRIFFTDILF